MFGTKMALYAGVDVNNYEPVSFQELVENNANFKAMHPLLAENTPKAYGKTHI